MAKKSNKPGCWIQADVYSKPTYRRFNTYMELKKNVTSLIEENKGEANSLTVCRTIRGVWGEWFEKWELVNGVPKIYEEGWS